MKTHLGLGLVVFFGQVAGALADENYPPWPTECDSLCPGGLTVKCMTRDALDTVCGKKAGACASDCTMNLLNDACTLFGWAPGSTNRNIPGTTFRDKTQCQRDPSEIPGGLTPDYVDKCCLVRHEYVHTCDPLLKAGGFMQHCAEMNSEDYEQTCESDTIEFMCQPDSTGHVRASEEQCRSFCSYQTYREVHRIWDTCMCGLAAGKDAKIKALVSAGIHPASGFWISQRETCDCVAPAADFMKAVSMMPPYCQALLKKEGLDSCSIAETANQETTGAHGADYYWVTDFDPKECFYPLNQGGAFLIPDKKIPSYAVGYGTTFGSNPHPALGISWHAIPGSDIYWISGPSIGGWTSKETSFAQKPNGLTQCGATGSITIEAKCQDKVLNKITDIGVFWERKGCNEWNPYDPKQTNNCSTLSSKCRGP